MVLPLFHPTESSAPTKNAGDVYNISKSHLRLDPLMRSGCSTSHPCNRHLTSHRAGSVTQQLGNTTPTPLLKANPPIPSSTSALHCAGVRRAGRGFGEVVAGEAVTRVSL